MSRNGKASHQRQSRRSYLVRVGRAEPIKYYLSVEEAIAAAGIKGVNP